MKFDTPHLPAGPELRTPPAVMPEKLPVSSMPAAETRRRLKAFVCFALILAACFGRTLYGLAVFAWQSEFYSYLLLVPFASAYLLKFKLRELDFATQPERRYALVPLTAGVGLLAGYWLASRRGWFPAPEDSFAALTLSLLCFLLADAWIFIGQRNLRTLMFPVAFTFFSIPFPEAMRRCIETFLQHASAEAAAAMLRLSGMPLLQEGTIFRLPGFSVDIAPECSGIHSSVILFITGLVAAYLLLKTTWARVVLTLTMVPLAILRNGFRIFTISQLCVHIGPHMINSPIHRRGGFIFFGLSLIPFALLLIFLRKKELQKTSDQPLSNA